MRKTLALMFGKFTSLMIKLILRRPSSFFPGKMALKVDPNILGKIKMPEKVVCITGTNGKTTTTNILLEIVKHSNLSYISNDKGSNMLSGLVNVILENGDIKGNTNADIGIFEVDERYSPKVFSYITPDLLLITNILRDSIKRNANTDYISYILSSSIPKTTNLLINGDDIIASTIAKENAREYYGISRLPSDRETVYNLVSDAVFYPGTTKRLEYDFVRINHQGRVKDIPGVYETHLDYEIINIDYEKNKIDIEFKNENEVHSFNIINNNISNIYNQFSAILAAYKLGVDLDTIKEATKKIKITESRHEEVELDKGKQLIKTLSKGQNPAATSNVLKFVSLLEKNKKVILNLADFEDNTKASETMMWIYETDFEFLKDDSIKEIILLPFREKDFLVRLLMAGIDRNKISIYTKNKELVDNLNLDGIDKLCILNDMYVEKEAQELKNLILNKFGK